MTDEKLERERFENLVKNNECMTYKVAIPTNRTGNAITIFEGTGDTMTIACLINFLENSLKKLKLEFPKEAVLSNMIGKRDVSTGYKKIKKER